VDCLNGLFLLVLFLRVEAILILVFGVDEIYCLTEVGFGMPPALILTEVVFIPLFYPFVGGLTP
jgi:hypothetical protein